MTQVYQIEKKTPASNWYMIHKNLDRDIAIELLADIMGHYTDMPHAEMVDDFERAMDDCGHVTTGEHEMDADGSTGDYIQFRIVAV